MDIEVETQPVLKRKKDTKPRAKKPKVENPTPVETTTESSDEESENCNICCSPCKSRNPKVKCPMCNFESCRYCCQTNIKTKMQEPACMGCKHVFGDMWIRANLTKSFFDTEVKQIRKNYVWQREQALLPSTVDEAQRTIELRKTEKQNQIDAAKSTFYDQQNKRLGLYLTQLRSLKAHVIEYWKLVKTENKHALEICKTHIYCLLGAINLPIDQISTDLQPVSEIPTKEYCEQKIKEIDAKLITLYNLRNQGHRNNTNRRYPGVNNNNNTEVVEKRTFTRGCPQNDCRGYIQPLPGNHRLGCSLCQTECCIKCHIIVKNKEDDKNAAVIDGEDEEKSKDKPKHVCKQEDIDTVKQLKKDTKDCPRCHALIFKISGCDVMFCTSCNTAFSWNSGTILDANRVHNPHLAQFLARGGNVNREQLNNHEQCPMDRERIRDINRLCTFFINNTKSNKQLTENLNWLIRVANICLIIYNDSENQLRGWSDNVITSNCTRLRVCYLLKEIDVKKLQTEILKQDKEYKLRKELHDIYEAFSRTFVQLIQPMIHQPVLDLINNSTRRNRYGGPVTDADTLSQTLRNIEISPGQKYMYYLCDPKTFQELKQQVQDLKDFFNESLDLIRQRFETSRLLLNIQDDWSIKNHH